MPSFGPLVLEIPSSISETVPSIHWQGVWNEYLHTSEMYLGRLK